MINILQNAKDAFKQNSIKNPKITITTHHDRDNLTISIQDNAGGINKDVIESIFEPYFTTKHSSVGTGLGLFVASLIVEQTFEGILKVENIKYGARFDIIMPIKHQKGCKCCS